MAVSWAENVPTWTRATLFAAAGYNIAWGIFVVLWPAGYFHLLNLTPPTYLSLWQCIGMIVGVYGVGYAIAARDPVTHWPIILVGFLGKVLGPLGFGVSLLNGTLPPIFGLTIITNDLIWLPPFAMILFAVVREKQFARAGKLPPYDSVEQALAEAKTVAGHTVGELSEHQPVLLVFLRHLGCIFCLESVQRIVRERGDIDRTEAKIVLVTMSEPDKSRQRLAAMGVGDIEIISDPDQRLYRRFGIGRGTFTQLFGPRVLVRGFQAALSTGRFWGGLEGDGFQLPGLVLIENRRVIRSYDYQTAADTVDFAEFAACALPSTQPRPETA